MDAFRLPEHDGWLDFEEGPITGARIRVRLAAPLAFYFGLLEAVDSGDVLRLRQGLRDWATNVLLEWNIQTADGEPIPATADGFEQLPMPSALAVVRAWLNTIPEVDLPLGVVSPDGGTSAARPVRARRRRS